MKSLLNYLLLCIGLISVVFILSEYEFITKIAFALASMGCLSLFAISFEKQNAQKISFGVFGFVSLLAAAYFISYDEVERFFIFVIIGSYFCLMSQKRKIYKKQSK
ncbi:hypothetical protein CAPN008_19960 [Capnocytophaga canis]|uniref:hypothetical protein n=1 Tax=Capnocytophaga canis TaxID=1848903 RepID=UPI001AD4C183|nr:hypothetical protein [Capnocytophaga canis]GIM61946.1 hypothetical protein CAPN008_19960 [Capnocytophaga canis]